MHQALLVLLVHLVLLEAQVLPVPQVHQAVLADPVAPVAQRVPEDITQDNQELQDLRALQVHQAAQVWDFFFIRPIRILIRKLR